MFSFARFLRRRFPVPLAFAAAAILLLLAGPPDARADFIRGDANGDSKVDLADAIATLGFLFQGEGGIACLDVVDADDNGRTNITDAIYILRYLYLAGPEPLPPFPGAGADPTPDGLACSLPAAPHLDERPGDGTYAPYYKAAPMHRPRYMHEAVRIGRLVLVVGGTDEKGFTSIDLAEIYDETAVRDGEPPPTGSGWWIDTDFEGEPMRLELARVGHTATVLPDGRVLVIGGAEDFLKSKPIGKAEVFDPATRRFETLEAEMVLPRSRHTATLLEDGTVLIAGGQVHDTFTDLITTGDGTVVEVTIDIFPSTNRVEVFDPGTTTFAELTFPGSTRPSTLANGRGRVGHVAARFAGPDARIGTGDDLDLLVGGFNTPVAPDLVPQTKFPRPPNTTALRTLEAYNPTLHVFDQIGNLSLSYPRVNDPCAANLGVFNETTLDGVGGLGNVILIANGDDNAACFVTAPEDELISAHFTGFGPAWGLQFYRIAYPDGGESGHVQAQEALAAGATVPARGRTMTGLVPLPRLAEGPGGTQVLGTWFFTGGGVAAACTEGTNVTFFDGPVASGCLFDPLYRLIPAADFFQVPPPDARDLTATRQETQNPTGVVGTWLALDGKLPGRDRTGYGDVPVGEFAKIRANRCWTKLVAVAGEDGLLDTPDDRVLFTGGGQDPLDGGEPSVPSSEVVLIPDSPER